VIDGRMTKRSVTVAGHRTSITLEAPFWEALKALARARGQSVNALVAAVDRERRGSLSGALRVFVLEAVQEGHHADHGLSFRPDRH